MRNWFSNRCPWSADCLYFLHHLIEHATPSGFGALPITSLCGWFQLWNIQIIFTEAIKCLLIVWWCETIWGSPKPLFNFFFTIKTRHNPKQGINIFLLSHKGLPPLLLWSSNSLLFLLFLLLSFHPLQSVNWNVMGLPLFEVKTWRAPPAATLPLLCSHHQHDLSLTDRCLVKLHTDWPEVAFREQGDITGLQEKLRSIGTLSGHAYSDWCWNDLLIGQETQYFNNQWTFEVILWICQCEDVLV